MKSNKDNRNSFFQNHESPILYSNLPEIENGNVKKVLNIGIVTPEIMGLSHGGIGTAYHALAESLANDGNRVSLLFVPLENPQMNLLQNCRSSYSKKNIQLEVCPVEGQEDLISLWTNAKRSYKVMQWLMNMRPYDILHFPEWKGLGYYTTLAKDQGLCFLDTAIVVGTHSSTFWDATYSYGDKAYYQDFMERNFLEKESVRLSDCVVSPSQYYLNWLKMEQNWKLPDRCYVQPNIMKSNLPPRPQENRANIKKPTLVHEIVFFGRLEKRKGIALLCDALDHPDICNRNDFSVSFMGHSTYINGKTAHEYLKERSSRWKFSWKIIPRKNRDEALSYLREPGRLALIPSLSETMSYTVLECLWAEIPFLASRVGGIPELIDPSDLERVTFKPLPQNLALALERIIGQDAKAANPAFGIKENEKRWIDWHQYIAITKNRLTNPNNSEPLISICLVIDESDSFPAGFESSLNSQEYSSIEIIVIRKGYDATGSVQDGLNQESQKNGWHFLILNDCDISTARNFAARNASGKYLLFLDLDIQMDNGLISCLISVAEKVSADILTFAKKIDLSSETIQSKKSVQFYLGNCVSLGALHNVFGDSNMLVKRTVFEKLSGFLENNYLGDSVWEFFARASLSGYKLETIPVPLIQKRSLEHQNFRSPRFVYPHPYLSQIPSPFHDLVNFVQASRFFHDPAPNGSFVEGFVNRPQEFVDEYWNSRPWRLFLSVANRVRRVLGFPCYHYPRVTSLPEAINAVQTVQQTIFWGIIVHIKKIRNIIKNFG